MVERRVQKGRGRKQQAEKILRTVAKGSLKTAPEGRQVLKPRQSEEAMGTGDTGRCLQILMTSWSPEISS
jgi:hypothetical protein